LIGRAEAVTLLGVLRLLSQAGNHAEIFERGGVALHSPLLAGSWPDLSGLYIQEAGAGGFGWDGTGIVAAEDAVAGAGYEAVGPVAEGARDGSDDCGEAPEAAELVKDKNDSVGAGQQALVSEIGVHNDVDGIEVGGIRAVAGQDAGRQRALQRGEAEDGVRIAAEDELDKAVAESADAVVEEDGRGHGWGCGRL